MKKHTLTLVIISLLGSSTSLMAQNKYFYPEKGDTVKFDRNEFFTFLWPESLLPDTPFTFVLTSLLPKQSPGDASKDNPPIYADSTINQYYINYPWFAPDLDTGTYMWQITSHGRIVHTSLFSIYDFPQKEIPYTLMRFSCTHASLKEEADGALQTAYDKWLYIHYRELYWVASTQNLRFRVLDKRRNTVADTDETGAVKTGSFPPVPIQYGDNWLVLKLESCIDYYNYYTLEVWNAKGEILLMPFYCTSSLPFIASGIR
ncbi:MAG: hypothetical protein LBK03_02630 [Bacteroidales bacterium]|jgi:hypothetical protein|nr:hypothetical protein [Bacteroidales bacterium]